jgi:hypothetical protein
LDEWEEERLTVKTGRAGTQYMDGFSLWFSQCLAMLHPKSAKEGREKGGGKPKVPNYQNLALCVSAGKWSEFWGGNIAVSVSV